ncbi:DNA helicase MCM9 [Thelohanellus kitauei]|uniref:DNA helicase n=1 Tax=Thelohanellus kitauei TaxID=669202 RepID=A0A0C2I5R6_THEKT|nr:DNA helicase MCM9 [Thelohanellus kitauei]
MFYVRKFACQVCDYKFDIDVDIVRPLNQEVEPVACPSPDDCPSKKFVHLQDMCTDYQEVILQEVIESHNGKGMMNSITTFLQDELVDQFKPGDHVIVYGTVLVRFKTLSPNSFLNCQLFLRANNIVLKHQNNDKTQILSADFSNFWQNHRNNNTCGYARDQIVNSLCPQLYGLDKAKLAIMLGVIGGTNISDSSSGTKQRGESHILLVGDPGCGKSQLLKQACRVVQKSIFTSGAGTTSAGLTASVTKEAGFSHWNLEAGALPSVNFGICCIDEFNSLRKADKITMEQQTVSVAKAGIVCHLKTNVSILAACNLRQGHSDNLCDLIGIPSPLLSRFDLIVFLKDAFDPSIDEILKKYYQHCRSRSCRDTSRTTIRMLESLTRLATAHAKLMFHTEVSVEDALTAVELMDHSISFENLQASVRNVFVHKPEDSEITTSSLNILKMLNLEHLKAKTNQAGPEITIQEKRDEDIIDLLIGNSQNSQNTGKSSKIDCQKVAEKGLSMDFDENYFDSFVASTAKIAETKETKVTFQDRLKLFKK